MSIEIEFEQHGDLLIARCRGAHTPAAVEETYRRVTGECNARNLRKIVIDQRQLTGSAPSSIDLYDAATSLHERGFSPGMKIVFVDDEKYRRANTQYRLVARNRGWGVHHAYSLDDAFAVFDAGSEETASPITVDFENGGDVLIARCEGTLTSATTYLIDSVVAQRCAAGPFDKVLIDIRKVGGHLEPIESHREGLEMDERGFDRRTKIAWVDREEFRVENTIYNLSATNRGYNMGHFYSFDEALAWLSRP